MSCGLKGAYEELERQGHLKALGLCIHCEQRSCTCEYELALKALNFQVELCENNLQQAQEELEKFLDSNV